MKTTTIVLATTALAFLFISNAPALATDKGDKKNAPEANQPKRPRPEATAPPKNGPRDGAPGKVAVAKTKEGKMFATYDKDQDGGVTAREIEAMREGKLSSAQRREIRKQVKAADVDKNGSLDLVEYTWWLKNREKMELDRCRGSRDTGRGSAEG